MSRSSVYDIFKTKKNRVAAYSNGYGTGYILWEWMAERFMRSKSISDSKEFWDLSNDERVPLAFRLCFAFTFDYALVPPEHFERMREACAEVYTVLDTSPVTQGSVNHWGALSEFFKTHKVSSRCMGVGMQVTSVCDVWDDYPKHGTKDRVFDCVGSVLKI